MSDILPLVTNSVLSFVDYIDIIVFNNHYVWNGKTLMSVNCNHYSITLNIQNMLLLVSTGSLYRRLLSFNKSGDIV